MTKKTHPAAWLSFPVLVAAVLLAATASEAQSSVGTRAFSSVNRSVSVFSAPLTTVRGGSVPTGSLTQSFDAKLMATMDQISSTAFTPVFNNPQLSDISLSLSNPEDGGSLFLVSNASTTVLSNEWLVRFPFYTTGQNGALATNPGSVELSLSGLATGKSYAVRCKVTEIESHGAWPVSIGTAKSAVTPTTNGDLLFAIVGNGKSVSVTVAPPTFPCPTANYGWCNMYSPYLAGCYVQLLP